MYAALEAGARIVYGVYGVYYPKVLIFLKLRRPPSLEQEGVLILKNIKERENAGHAGQNLCKLLS